MKQIVNLRSNTGTVSGDLESQQTLERRVEEARAEAYRRGYSHVIAPNASLRLADGRLLRAGDELRPCDLEGGSLPPLRALRALVDSGRALEVYAVASRPGTGPEAA